MVATLDGSPKTMKRQFGCFKTMSSVFKRQKTYSSNETKNKPPVDELCYTTNPLILLIPIFNDTAVRPNSQSKAKLLFCSPNDCSKRFTLFSLADQFNQILCRFLWEASSHAAINARRLFVDIYSSLSVARHSFIQLGELE